MMKVVLILLMLWSISFSERGFAEEPLDGLAADSLSRKVIKKKPLNVRFPEVTAEIQEATGSYSKKEINTIADNGMLSLRNIYYKYLEKKLDFEGDVLFKFTIAGNGEVSNIDILSSTTGNAEFDEAIKNKMATWKWKTTRSGKATLVTLLFKFTIIGSYNYAGVILGGTHRYNIVMWNMNMLFPRLHNIYVAFHKLKPDFSGKIVLKYTVAESGEITKVDITVSTTEYPEFDEAIKNELAAWKWKTKNESYSGTIMSEFKFGK